MKMQQKNELIAYAIDFASYLISKIDGINRIILHGSIARGDFDEESDVDLFVDTKEKEEKINKITDNYYKTKKFEEWKLKDISNKFSIIIGELDSKEWQELKRSIINTGIVLYGKYKSEVEKINQYTLFSFENIKPDKKRITIFRKLYGFKIGKKQYLGIVNKINAIKVGKGCLLVPAEHVNKLKKYFQEKKVAVKIYDLWSDTKLN